MPAGHSPVRTQREGRAQIFLPLPRRQAKLGHRCPLPLQGPAHGNLESLKGLKLGQTPDAVLTDVEAAMEAMGEVTGAIVREDITARIFERFCVGK